jgi:prolipoprotein diacylglyceryltransferase
LARATAGLGPGKLPNVPASISLDFDPQTTIFGAAVRLETLALAGVIFVALVFAGFWAGRSGAGLFERHPEGKEPPRLRRDDLILIAFGVVPGAVVGGRLDYVLVHLDYYQLHNEAILDVNQGGLGLTLAVVLGTLTGAAVAKLMNAPIGRWLAVLAMPTMFALGAGKLATILGGAGQGTYSDAGWATSYAGAGPWESLNPSYPAIPAQAIEGGIVLAAMLIFWVVPPLLRLRLRRWRSFVRPGMADRTPWNLFTGGRRFLTMLGIWAALRFAAAYNWRDAKVAGQLNAEQLILFGVVVVAALGPSVATAAVWTARATGRGTRQLARRASVSLAERRARRARPAVVVESKVQAAEATAARVQSAAPVGPIEAKLPVEEVPHPRRIG